MFQNTNNKFIIDLAMKNYRVNKVRNRVCIIAVALTAFMIISVFSVGFSYIDSYDLQQLQLIGTAGEAMLDNPTQEQINILEDNKMIETIGLREDVVQAGSVNYEDGSTKLYYAFRYYDEQEWDKHRVPALANIIGNYPRNSNEIMLPSWALKKMGLTSKNIGSKLNFSYNILGKTYNRLFILTGVFDEYDNTIKDGSVVYALVSQKFSDEVSIEGYEKIKIADISFVDGLEMKQVESIEDELQLQNQQQFSVNPVNESSMKKDIILSVSFVAVCIAISGYLLIYNIFNISVINNIHFYGQIKVLGLTRRHIKLILMIQGLIYAVLGIFIGISMGCFFSNIMVPSALNILMEKKSGIIVDIDWKMILGTIVFTVLTVVIAVRKPATIAGKISPIEALRYESKSAKSIKRKRKEISISKMAFENIVNDKRRFILVLLSLTFGITFCLGICTMVLSMNADSYVENSMNADVELKNKTVALGYEGDLIQIFDKDFTSELTNLKGINSISTIKQRLVAPVYTENVMGDYIKQELGQEYINDKTYISSHPELFYSQLIGISYNDQMEKENPEIDWEKFENGDICLIANNNHDVFQVGDMINFELADIKSGQGKAEIYGDVKKIQIGGFLSSEYNNMGGIRSAAPYLFVSQNYLDRIANDAIITNVLIDTDDKNEEQINESVNKLVDSNQYCNEIVMVSALEKMKGLKEAKLTLLSMGGGLSIVLSLIGILNFVNVIITSIAERKSELTIMECIGFTKKQIIKMVYWESLDYFAITMMVVLTFGNVIIGLEFQLFKKIVTYAEFTYPFVILFIIMLLLFLVCYFIPRWELKKLYSTTIVARMNGNR